LSQGPEEQVAMLVLVHNALKQGCEIYSSSMWIVEFVYKELETEEDEDINEWLTLLMMELLEPKAGFALIYNNFSNSVKALKLVLKMLECAEVVID
jgi:hypothetical protein